MKLYLLLFLFVFFLSPCQLHGQFEPFADENKIEDFDLELNEDEIKASSLEELIKGLGMGEENNKIQMQQSAEDLLRNAARHGWLPVMYKLLLEGVPVDSKNEYGHTPLNLAAYYGRTEAVRLLLDKGASVDGKDDIGSTPLHTAADQSIVQLLEVAQLLIERGADVNSTDNDNITPLHNAAWWGHTEIARLLLEKGARVDSKTSLGGLTPLHNAVYFGHTEVAALLLSHGADLTTTDRHGETVLQVAQTEKRTETAAFLKLAESKSKEWLRGYCEGFSSEQERERDKKKIHAYAEAYADIYEEKIESGDSPEKAKATAEAMASTCSSEKPT